MPSEDLVRKIIRKYGPLIDIGEKPEILDELLQDLATSAPAAVATQTTPFGISWMDSWVAHWTLARASRATTSRSSEVGLALQAVTDLKFDQRLREIRDFVELHRGRLAEPPDAGPPEPGVPPGPPEPPAGPEAFFTPDGGVPEPGVPPAGPAGIFTPDGGPPEPGVPPAGPAGIFIPDAGPPEPGVPPTGPDDLTALNENPWILYWFMSIKAPMLLDVIDLHMTRRLEEMIPR